jgi:hypothetical protein
MSSTGETIKDHASRLIEPAKERARQLAEEKKAQGADRLDAVAHAVHDAADRLGSELPPSAAGAIHDAAGGIERASSAIRESTIDDMLRAVGNFARQQPVAFFGGAVLAGFTLSRFLKSTAEPGRRPSSQQASSPPASPSPAAVGGVAYGAPADETARGVSEPGGPA